MAKKVPVLSPDRQKKSSSAKEKPDKQSVKSSSGSKAINLNENPPNSNNATVGNNVPKAINKATKKILNRRPDGKFKRKSVDEVKTVVNKKLKKLKGKSNKDGDVDNLKGDGSVKDNTDNVLMCKPSISEIVKTKSRTSSTVSSSQDGGEFTKTESKTSCTVEDYEGIIPSNIVEKSATKKVKSLIDGKNSKVKSEKVKNLKKDLKDSAKLIKEISSDDKQQENSIDKPESTGLKQGTNKKVKSKVSNKTKTDEATGTKKESKASPSSEVKKQKDFTKKKPAKDAAVKKEKEISKKISKIKSGPHDKEKNVSNTDTANNEKPMTIKNPEEKTITSNDNILSSIKTKNSKSIKSKNEKEGQPKRKYVRKKPLKSELKAMELNKIEKKVSPKVLSNDEKSSKDVYDFHESCHSNDNSDCKKKSNVVIKKENSTNEIVENEKLFEKPSSTITSSTGECKSDISQKICKESNDSKDSKTNNKNTKKISKKPKKEIKSESSTETDTDSSSSNSNNSKRAIDKKKKIQDARSRRMKLFGFYSGPKKHRMASLNALAKVQCMYENESRTAQELGFTKEIKQPVMRESNSGDKIAVVNKSIQNTKEPVDDKSDQEKDKLKELSTRSLRNAPGLRGAGKFFEIDDLSSSDSDSESTVSNKKVTANKSRMKKKPTAKIKEKQEADGKQQKIIAATVKQKNEKKSNQSQPNNAENSTKSTSNNGKSTKRKLSPNPKDPLSMKRMASLNASAMLAATYEVERHFDRLDESSSESSSERIPKKEVKSEKKVKDEKIDADDSKEIRPVSTNVMIVQDTDVTITGVYVNSSIVGTSQEAYCKMQYRVQSSVTEERVVRAATATVATTNAVHSNFQQEPPKSYTPLSALSSMKPPGTSEGNLLLHNTPNVHVTPPAPIPLHSTGVIHCEPQIRYPTASYHHGPFQSIPGSSAFCAPNPGLHHHYHYHEPPPPPPPSHQTGYYQPAGPLISSHLSGPNKPADTEQTSSTTGPSQSQPHLSAAKPADNTESNETLLTSGAQAFRYAAPPIQTANIQPAGSYGQTQMHQMHCPTYPPANYYSPYGQHPQEMCYPPPYHQYEPPKLYTPPGAPAYHHRRYMLGPYYPAGHTELYETGTQVAPPPPSGSQLVPAGPSGPHQLDHYPGPPPYYTGYSPGMGQCYPRGIQAAYLESTSYPNSCPCPMQSCPKNVLTGPLIGSSKTGKGPVQTNPLIASVIDMSNAQSCGPMTLLSSTTSHTPSFTASTNPLSNSVKVVSSIGTIASNKIHSCNDKTYYTNAMQHQDQQQSSLGSQLHYDQQQSVAKQHGSYPLMNPSIVIKPKTEISHSYGIDSTAGGIDATKKSKESTDNTGLVQLPYYTLNSKVMEPDMSISPARGSTGLPLPPDQAGAVQPKELMTTPTHHEVMTNVLRSKDQRIETHRKARLGKTMAREAMMTSYNSDKLPAIDNNYLYYQASVNESSIDYSTKPDKQSCDVSKDLSIPIIVKSELNIKKERIECDQQDECCKNVAQSENGSKEFPELVKIKSEINECGMKTVSGTNELCEQIDKVLPENQITTVKRKKLLELNKANSKKSPTNGYKSLIKQTEPKPYLLKPANALKSNQNCNDTVNRPNTKQQNMIKRHRRKIMLTTKRNYKERLIRRRKLRQMLHSRNSSVETSSDSCEPRTVPPVGDLNWSRMAMASSVKEIDENQNTAVLDGIKLTPIDDTIDQVAKGNFNEIENEILTDKCIETDGCTERLIEEQPTDQQPNNNIENLIIDNSVKESVDNSSNSESGKAIKKDKQNKKKVDKTKNSKSNKTSNDKTVSKAVKPQKKQDTKEQQKPKDDNTVKNRSYARSKSAPVPPVHQDESEFEIQLSKSCTSRLIDLALEHNKKLNNNNNDILVKNHNKPTASAKSKSRSSSTTTATTTSVPTGAAKIQNKRRSRSKSTGSSKRRKTLSRSKHVTEEIEVPPVPRKSSTVPRWSNGWHWNGEPFQAKVYLNSDDQPVTRTCYPSMIHDEGDIIQPRDCVLLKAGTKKNELPYVAKVTSLWENPEDGEMMMSLLWYYRPEHTEQGRQQFDCVDEVFASRHKDHNSVACIEDKCYVLTFNEYCRYRRKVRALEENILDNRTAALVPPLGRRVTPPHREVPLHTNPDLILFCRKVYEFRQKKLIKNPS